MATKIIGQGTAASTNLTSRPVAQVHEHALEVLNELRVEQDKAFSIAFAGTQCCAKDDEILPRNIFSVIEDMLADGRLIGSLRGLINELAEAAGSDYMGSRSNA
ncbi:hypothetical protein [Variovorax atrisoli]|uniref:hypothetical protein n=1 Tax=Variovorax atrisoli TaxID=3394203 RepID=UPI001621E5FB|nr:hypothetical protein [Variovorax sp. BK613]MBB3637147.1 hypothetical protein [Variovorax sp. BK613]